MEIKGVEKVIVGREWSYLNTTVSGDINIVICYDVIKQINNRLLDEVDELERKIENIGSV